MKKIQGIGIATLLALPLLSCSNQAAPTNNAPTVVGIKDVQCIVNSTVDFLDGVAALDREDGDITPNMEISITPEVPVKDGYASFSKTGEYTVNYKVTDSGGRTFQKRSYVDVVARERYVGFDLPQGYGASASGEASFTHCGMRDGHFLIQAKGNQVAEDIIISRKLTIKTNVQYTLNFTVESRCKGRVKAMANGLDCAEMYLDEGIQTLSFSHIVLDEEKSSREVEFSLCLGNIATDIDLTLLHLEVEYPQEEGKIVDLTEKFSFGGRVLSRIESGCEGNTWVEDNGKTAVLEVTKAIPEIWLGGMFINTGIELKEGVTYTVSFDLEAERKANYEVIIQRSQWDEKQLSVIYNPEDGHYSRDITIDSAGKGPLWLYVQSGTETNRIRMKNLKVEEHLSAIGKENYPIEDYGEYHENGYQTEIHSSLGNFTYHIGEFAPNDSQEKVTSPTFYVNGSGGNYVLSFKAKASAPIEVVVAAPVSGGWDPTLMWNRISLSENETAYTFFFSGAGSDRDYTVVWQFGSTNNQKYHDVDIEVSDVSISLRNHELDG